MKITNATVNICSPGRNFVTLKIETDEGIYGLGDGTLNGRELAVVSYLSEHVVPCLIGRDPFQTEDIWQYLYRGAYWRRGPVTMSAIGAVDMALWDIKGKALETPVYNLLGGKSRNGCMVYAHANGADVEQTIDAVAREIDRGYLAVRAQSGIPGLDSTYGVAEGEQAVRAGGARAADGEPVVDGEVSAACSEAVRAAAGALWRGCAPAARLPSPAHAD